MKADDSSERSIRELLSELSESDAVRVEPVLRSLQTMADGEASPVSPALAAAIEATRSRAARSRRMRRRGLVFSLATIGALLAGAGTATAVSPDFRTGAAHAFDGLVNALPFAHPPRAHPSPVPSPGTGKHPTTPTTPGSTRRHTPSPQSGNGSGDGNSSNHPGPKSTAHPTTPSKSPHKGRGADAP